MSTRHDQERVIRTFERFRFEDARAETVRRARLGDARRCHALALVARGQIRSARTELRAANAIAPPGTGEGWGTLTAISMTMGRPRLQLFTARHPRAGAVLHAFRNRRRLAMAR
jgi:hypothetical protein